MLTNYRGPDLSLHTNEYRSASDTDLQILHLQFNLDHHLQCNNLLVQQRHPCHRPTFKTQWNAQICVEFTCKLPISDKFKNSLSFFCWLISRNAMRLKDSSLNWNQYKTLRYERFHTAILLPTLIYVPKAVRKDVKRVSVIIRLRPFILQFSLFVFVPIPALPCTDHLLSWSSSKGRKDVLRCAVIRSIDLTSW